LALSSTPWAAWTEITANKPCQLIHFAKMYHQWGWHGFFGSGFRPDEADRKCQPHGSWHCGNASTQMDLGSQRVKLLISEYRIFTLMLRHLSPNIKLTE